MRVYHMRAYVMRAYLMRAYLMRAYLMRAYPIWAGLIPANLRDPPLRPWDRRDLRRGPWEETLGRDLEMPQQSLDPY